MVLPGVYFKLAQFKTINNLRFVKSGETIFMFCLPFHKSLINITLNQISLTRNLDQHLSSDCPKNDGVCKLILFAIEFFVTKSKFQFLKVSKIF